ncbi:MAG: cyclic nucleotide-binding domain-containing protein [Leptospirales bacterium]|nr:cyclic nucleotide-binding domain-containing protein [Leptospirales bacterium]
MSLNIFEYVNNLATDIRKEGDAIFRQGDESDGRMYFVAEGELVVIRDIDGEPHELNRLQPGAFFGEMAILSRTKRTATVKVVSRLAKLGYLDENVFMKIARTNPVFLYSLLKLVIQRIAMIEDQIDDQLRQVEARRRA